MPQIKHDIKSGSLFPWYFQLVGVFAILGAVSSFQSNLILALVLLVVGLFILTSYSGIEFNSFRKTYKPYYSFFFLKAGKARTYGEVEKIFVNANKVSQKIYTAHTLNSSTFKNIEFDAYIKFSNGNKAYLLSNKSKRKLMDNLQGLSLAMQTSIVDNTHH